MLTDHEYDLQKYWGVIYQSEYPFEYPQEKLPELTPNVDINDKDLEKLQYQCPLRRLKQLHIEYSQDMLLETMYRFCEADGAEDEIFYTHGDHLGSANWITDYKGYPIQYLHYMPYGQLLANQTLYGYDERYKFTGKERDAETGYDFFGARYYWSLLKHWTKVDPLVDNYLWISPYAYCNWNPVKYVDPDGRDWYEADGEIKWTELKSQQAMDEAKQAGKYLGEAVAVFNGYRNEHFGTKNGRGKYLGGDDAKLADVILYGPKGSDDITMGLKGFTMTSDYDKYGAIDNGTWPANYDTKGKGGKIESHWTLNYRGFIPTYDYQPNMSPYAGELKGTMYKNGIFIHSTMGPDNRVGATTSTGCLLLDWNSMQIFNEKMTGVRHFSVQVKRN